jgi:DNA-binding MarR family transcriptional regulator
MKSLDKASKLDIASSPPIRQHIFLAVYEKEKDKDIYAQEIGKETGIEANIMSFHVGVLEKHGLIKRDSPKGSTRLLKQTDDGLKVFKELKVNEKARLEKDKQVAENKVKEGK